MPYLGNTAGNRFVASKAATQFSGDGSETVFTLDHAVGSDEDILVSVDGVIQEPSVAYAVSSGTTLTFTAAPSNNSGNNIFVYYLFRTVATVNHPSTSSLQATDGTFSGVLKTDDTTEATSTTDGSLQTDGGLSVAKDIVAGDDIHLKSDSSQITFGADSEVRLDHTHNTGLTLQGSGLNTNFSLLSFDTTDGTIPDLRLGKSSSATVGTFAETASGESLGQIRFTGVDSNNSARDGASIVCEQNASSGASSVSAKVEYTANDHSLFIGTFKALNVASTGRVNINTTENVAQLNVASPNLAASADALRLTNQVNNTGGYFIRFVNSSGGVAGYIEQTGSTSVSYSTSSDYRLKENVSDMTDATTRLKQLKPKRFNFITEPDTTLDGFLAHEVESIVPEAISGTHNELEVWKEGEELPDGVSVGDNKLDDDGNTIPKYQGIDQSKLVPLLVKTIQELEARITALESK